MNAPSSSARTTGVQSENTIVEVGLAALVCERAVRLAQPLRALDHERLRVRDALLCERGEKGSVAHRSLVTLQLGNQHAAHVEQHRLDARGGASGLPRLHGQERTASGLRTSRREIQIDSS